ncbi:MAG: TlpA family protein disulfide reductase [Solirubrobacteraceae bacterium]
MKQNKLFFISLALIFTVLVFYISPLGNAFKSKSINDEQQNATKMLLTEQDFNLELKGINTTNINLKSLKGKVIFINFWGIWCPPCKQEMPTIQAIHNKFKNEVSFVMLAIPARGEELKTDVSNFLTENNYNFPTYETSAVPSIKFQSNAVPLTVIINKKGEIVAKVEGSKDWNDEASNELLKKLIKE